MNLISALVSGSKNYAGIGLNHEGQEFIGSLVVQPLLDSLGVMLHYTATLSTGEQVHAECTLMAPDMNGELTLWPVMSELPGVLPHKATSVSRTEATFSSGDRDDLGQFREEIRIRLSPDGSLAYAHAWGMPGGKFEDRSSCSMFPSDA
jgi:hypothetical protein